MNEEQIEKLLREAPAVRPPAGLAEKLKRSVRLTRVDAGGVAIEPRTWLRRWMPAFSLAVFFIACVVAVGMQSGTISSLKTDNEKLEAGIQNLEQLRADNAEYKQLAAQADQLDQLRKDNADLLRLRDEVTQLKANAQEMDNLRAENQSLRSQIQAVPTGGSSSPDFFSDAQAKAQQIQCQNNLKQIGLAARIWAGDNNDAYPTNFISMKNELNNWKILQCPGDSSRNVTSWSDVESGNVSYTLLSPVEETYPYSVLAYCPIHHNYCLADGSVQHLSPEAAQKYIKDVDGRLTYVPPTQ
jgi:uncharacterized protein YdcH (DUF465 family)